MAIKKRLSLVFAPSIIYLLGFVVPAAIAMFGQSGDRETLSDETRSLIWVAIAGFYGGLVLNSLLKAVAPGARAQIEGRNVLVLASERRAFLAIASLFFLCGAALTAEFVHAGGIPALSPNVDAIRQRLQINGYVHLTAMSLGTVALVAGAFSMSVNGRARARFAGVSILGFFGMMLTANRSDLFVPLFALIIFGLLIRRIKLSVGTIVGVFSLLVVFVAIKLIRDAQVSPLSVGGEALSQAELSSLISIASREFYDLLALNFHILDLLVSAQVGGDGGGLYVFNAVLSPLGLGASVAFGDYKNQVLGLTYSHLGIDYEIELTSTYVSNLYVDYGFHGVWLGSTLLGLAFGAAHSLASSDSRFCLLYALACVYCLSFFYMYPLVYTGWVLNLVVLALVGLVAYRKPGRKSPLLIARADRDCRASTAQGV